MVKVKLFDFQEKVQAHNLKVFTPSEFQRLMGVQRKAAQELLGRYVRKGAVLKLRNKFYATSFNLPSPYLIANKIYQPSYVSFEAALSYHGIIPETVYEVASATTKATREFRVGETVFSYHRIKESAYTGYSPTGVGGDVILMAEPEKALVDYLYFVHLGRKVLNDRLSLRNIDGRKASSYSRLFRKKGFARFVEDVVC